MSAHVRVTRSRESFGGQWVAECRARDCRGWLYFVRPYPTHAEALAAAWAHIKEHS